MGMIKVLFIYDCRIKHRQGPEVVGYLEFVWSLLPPHRIWPCFDFAYILYDQFRLLYDQFRFCHVFYAIIFFYNPASTEVLPNNCSMMGQRRRRRPSMEP